MFRLESPLGTVPAAGVVSTASTVKAPPTATAGTPVAVATTAVGAGAPAAVATTVVGAGPPVAAVGAEVNIAPASTTTRSPAASKAPVKTVVVRSEGSDNSKGRTALFVILLGGFAGGVFVSLRWMQLTKPTTTKVDVSGGSNLSRIKDVCAKCTAEQGSDTGQARNQDESPAVLQNEQWSIAGLIHVVRSFPALARERAGRIVNSA
ncbi:hypothetical protein CYMTET_47870 [Cymbomonas tetramitiformis]|uniref:Uncharacterized protein n=1 Tax=Cymbomonas tetramitiformis TaxID=36881 RepID=A0AAE0BUS4_9CHLO|nr:hypothetical protein CYMTET_47870 [Cymbomonas tetramitiformis]